MELYEEIASNRESGARRLVAEFKDRLYSAALLMGCDVHSAEDLVFRTFEQAILKIDRYRTSGSFYNWVFTIMVNFRRMDLRRQGSRIRECYPERLPERADSHDDPGEELARWSDARRVRAAVASLPEQFREVLVLRYFEDLPTAEIAEILGLPHGTVRSRLHYAKALVSERLRENVEHSADGGI